MRGKALKGAATALLLAASVGACASNGVQPGIVSRSGPPSTYNQAGIPSQSQGVYVQNASASAGATSGGTAVSPQQAAAVPGESGRVVSINEVGLQGGGGSGNGSVIGGFLGGVGGAVLGAVTGQTVGSGIVGGILGAVGGAIAGSIFDGRHGDGGGGRGIEVTVQKDDGSKVTIAQRDDGDIQLGDRVQVVQGRNGVAQVVRDTSRNPD
ncbi:Outer membrane lipoprotein SlyB [Enhydrobacter aerosaccus]|uniref:Outer membrane lipoprotein SlyB n=1 Tax=Enhydrobacter aerosaccus TaxID=225324 RepID=A0A1T4LJR4_9HYPH|nr:hypothetical protein [Enhydrobacter aerosaccus]SJZ54787.1 Outer membrane lipoprotein SlyB [Enhydrobacter aerosaccus]